MDIQIIRHIIGRDLEKLKNELLSYNDESAIWLVDKAIANSAGNLCLHLVGNLNTFIGKALGGTGYVRDRDAEFSKKNVPREELIRMISDTAVVVSTTLDTLPPVEPGQIFPVKVFEYESTTEYMLIHLATHLDYHLGQVNYHRRLLDKV
jgi:uncharacterized damage-inducible protein DinB